LGKKNGGCNGAGEKTSIGGGGGDRKAVGQTNFDARVGDSVGGGGVSSRNSSQKGKKKLK